MRAIQFPVYGDCLPTTTSNYMRGHADHHVEASVRIVVEVAAQQDDNFLAKGVNDCISRSTTYAMFSDLYQPVTNLASSEIYRLFHEETMNVVTPGEYVDT